MRAVCVCVSKSMGHVTTRQSRENLRPRLVRCRCHLRIPSAAFSIGPFAFCSLHPSAVVEVVRQLRLLSLGNT